MGWFGIPFKSLSFFSDFHCISFFSTDFYSLVEVHTRINEQHTGKLIPEHDTYTWPLRIARLTRRAPVRTTGIPSLRMTTSLQERHVALLWHVNSAEVNSLVYSVGVHIVTKTDIKAAN